jgi:hypothetical protein
LANDIFNRQTDQFGGSFSSDSAFITFPNVVGLDGAFAGDFGLLVQRLTTTYQQQVTRLYEVGTPAIYYVGGRTAGDSSIDRIVGPRKVQPIFYRKFGDVCQALSNTLDFAIQTGCGPGQATSAAGGLSGRASYTAYFCVITAIGLGIQASDMLINENLRLMFSSFEYGDAN